MTSVQIFSYKIHLSKLNNIRKKTKIDTYCAYCYFPLDPSTIHTSRTFLQRLFLRDRNVYRQKHPLIALPLSFVPREAPTPRFALIGSGISRYRLSDFFPSRLNRTTRRGRCHYPRSSR